MKLTIQGPQGCGKTIVLEALIHALEDYRVKIMVFPNGAHEIEFDLNERQKEEISKYGFID